MAEEISKEKLEVEIEKILKNANLETTTTKKVRLQLEKTLGVDLVPQKALINDIVMNYVNNKVSDEEEEEDVKKEESEEEEEVVENKRSTRKRKGNDSDTKPKKAKKAAGEGKKKGGKGSAYTRPYRLSPALGELMGAEQMPRHEVVKKVWEIIKTKNLYDPNNKQFAICDDALYKVIQKKRFRTFGMMKYLKTHFLDD